MDYTMQTVQATKRGEYVKRKPEAKAVYIRGAYDAGSKRYELTDAEDINRSVWVKGSVSVVVGFTY